MIYGFTNTMSVITKSTTMATKTYSSSLLLHAEPMLNLKQNEAYSICVE